MVDIPKVVSLSNSDINGEWINKNSRIILGGLETSWLPYTRAERHWSNARLSTLAYLAFSSHFTRLRGKDNGKHDCKKESQTSVWACRRVCCTVTQVSMATFIWACSSIAALFITMRTRFGTLAAQSAIFCKYLGNVGIFFRVERFFAERSTVFKLEWACLFHLACVTMVPRNGTSTIEAFCPWNLMKNTS